MSGHVIDNHMRKPLQSARYNQRIRKMLAHFSCGLRLKRLLPPLLFGLLSFPTLSFASAYGDTARQLATKIASMMRLLGLSRFDLAYATGRVPHKQRLATIELYGREVIPRVRELLADHPVPPIPSIRLSPAVAAQPSVEH